MDLQVDTELIAACTRLIDDAAADLHSAVAAAGDGGGPPGTTAGSAPVREAVGAGIRGSLLAIELIRLSAGQLRQSAASLHAAARAFDLIESTAGNWSWSR